MYIYSLNKLLIFFLLFICSSCYVTNYQTILKKKDGSDVILYKNGEQKVFFAGTMKERNKLLGKESSESDTCNYVKVNVQANKFNNLKINAFAIKIWYENADSFTKIDSGKIYFDSKLTSFNRFIDINDTLKDLSLEPMGIYTVNTIFITESEQSPSLQTSNKFLIETYLDFIIDDKKHLVNKIDTLYKEVIKKHRFTTH